MDKSNVNTWNYDRPSGFHQTIPFLHFAFPNAALMTYDNTKFDAMNHKLIAKIVLGVGLEPIWAPEATDATCDNFPGGLVSDCKLNGSKVHIEFIPLMIGRDEMKWEGAALFKIETKPAAPVHLKCGGSATAYMHRSPVAVMTSPDIPSEGSEAVLKDGQVIMTGSAHPLFVGIKASASGNMEIMKTETGEYAQAHFTDGEGWLLLSFSAESERAKELLRLDPVAEERKVRGYYSDLLTAWQIKTPDDDINEAFTHALLNMEYTWVRPWGWIESLHHWPCMWHQQYTSAADWASELDRSRECTEQLLENQFENGAIPDVGVGANVRRDEWGGANQYFFQSIEHYYAMSGDIDFIAKYEKQIEQAALQTYEHYDPAGTGLLMWGTQIGNQEDFECIPGGGAASSAEGVFMLRTVARFKRALHKPEEADRFDQKANFCAKAMMKRIWLKDLGRFAWFEDSKNHLRPDGAYHACAFPIKYDLLNDEEMTTCANHLIDRMSGPEGEVYLSNHFSDHAVNSYATWGMQAGAAQQPFGAIALAKAGRRNDAYRPLQFIAKRVCSDFQRGSWPECANEKRLAFYAPSAAVYAQAIIEAIFGAALSIPDKTITIQPSIPDGWPEAEIKLPGLEMKYKRTVKSFILEIKTTDRLKRALRWKLAPFTDATLIVNGKPVNHEVESGCGWLAIVANLPAAKNTVIEIKAKHIDLKIDAPKVICEGGDMLIGVKGATIVGLSDPCGMIQEFNPSCEGTEAAIRLRNGLLDDYLCYGHIGLMNFARRTFFLKLAFDGVCEYEEPVTITIVPKLCIGSRPLNGNRIELEVFNGSAEPISETVVLRRGNMEMMCKIKAAPGKMQVNTVVLTDDLIRALLPGDQVFRIIRKNGRTYDVTVDCGSGTRTGFKQLDIPPADMILIADSKKLRAYYSHEPFIGGRMNTFTSDTFKNDFAAKLLLGLPMPSTTDRMVPISHRFPIWKLNFNGLQATKLYIYVMNFADNHDFMSKLARIEIEYTQGTAYKPVIISRTLCYPGDLDGVYSPACTGFTTNRGERKRTELPLMPDSSGDYPSARPPLFPSPDFWATCRVAESGLTNVSLVEIDLGSLQELSELRIIPVQADAALGILGICSMA